MSRNNGRTSDLKDETDDLEAEIEAMDHPDDWDESDDRESMWERRMEEVNTVSGLIGQRLLQGWTLLADHCSECQTPLMSQQGGTPVCVMCESRRANAAASSQQTSAAASSSNIRASQPTPPRTTVNASTQAARRTTNMGSNGLDEEREERRRRRQNGRSRPLNTSQSAQTSSSSNMNSGNVAAAATNASPPPPRPSALRVRRSEEVEDEQRETVPRPRNVVDSRTFSTAAASRSGGGRNQENWDSMGMADPDQLRRNLSGMSNRSARGGARRQVSNVSMNNVHRMYSQTESELLHQLNHTMYQFTRKLYQFNVNIEQCDPQQVAQAIPTLENLIRGMRMVRTFRNEISGADGGDGGFGVVFPPSQVQRDESR